MRSRPLTLLAALALTVAGLAGGQLASAGPAAAEPVHCSTNVGPHGDYYSHGHIAFKIYSPGTLIRDHPYGDCNIREEAYGSGINVYCGKVNDLNTLWFYVKDMNTGTTGWVRWNNLRYDIPYTVYGEPTWYAVGGDRCGGIGTGFWEVYREQGSLFTKWGPAGGGRVPYQP